MAGAVSAGAYTAGVLDYLFEALNAWDARRRAGDTSVPDHKVQIRVIAGASAGSIAAGISAMTPFLGDVPVNDLQQAQYNGAPRNAQTNVLYRAWVEEIDLRPMLTISDLSSSTAPVRSFLNTNVVDDVANHAVATARAGVRTQRPPNTMPTYFANPLQLYLSLANLRGIPYLITMQTEGGVRGHRMVAHMDYAHFAVFGTNTGPSEPLPGGAVPVNWPNSGATKDGWDSLIDAALSSSAFPVGLRSRQYSNDISVYQSKLWPRAFGDDVNTPSPTIAPDLNPFDARPYTFWTCDGGLLNNEPLEYARVALAGSPDQRNPRGAKDADRAVVMIDPFPDDNGKVTPEEQDLDDVLSLTFALVPALKSQSRFKPQELALALREDIYSRFLIAPVRRGKKCGETDIASSGLYGFAGFLSRDFRRHDFQLGRVNCQKFLRDHLAVHVDNPIVAPWVARLRQNGTLGNYHTKTYDSTSGIEKVDENFVQLVPLMPAVSAQVQLLPWPVVAGGAEALVNELKRPISERLDVVVERIVPSLMKLMKMDSGFFAGLASWLGQRQLRAKLYDMATAAVANDLKTRGLG